MAVTQIDDKEILYKSSKPQRVEENGYVSIGRANKGKRVYIYAVEAK